MAEKKSLFSCVLDYIEAREKKEQAEKMEKEEKYLLRTQRIYEFHERQRTELVELRRCLEFVGEHAHVLGAALRAGASSDGAVPLAAALVRDVVALRASMQDSITNAARIRGLLATPHHPLMDNLLAKMESELNGWTAFLNGASRALVNSRALMENVQNLIVVQQRMVSEVASSSLFLSLEAEAGAESPTRELRPASAQLCSTPILDQRH